MTYADAAQAAGAVLLFGAAIGSLWRWIIRPLMRAGKLINRFFEDWFGEPERPGLPDGRKGVLERLDALEEQGRNTEQRTGRTEWHLGNGDPKRMRDVVNEIATKQVAMSRDQKALAAKVNGIGVTADHIDGAVSE